MDFPCPVIIHNRISGDLVHPTLELFTLLYCLDILVYLDENVLKNVCSSRFIVHFSTNKGEKPVVEFTPDFSRFIGNIAMIFAHD